MRFGFFGGKRREDSKRREDPKWAPPKPAKELMPEASLDEAVSADGFFRLPLDQFPLLIDGVVKPDNIDVEVIERLDRNVLLLSGGDMNAWSHGLTGGFSIRVPDTFESAVSGLRVRVKLLARSARGLADAEFFVAYSTADVGNSGWQKMSVGNTFETTSFEWDVPTMISGNGDYVGILPGHAGAIEVAGLVVMAVPRT
jgi:hypothetical protein